MRARHLTILTLFFCLTSLISNAQLAIGLRAGYNASDILFKPAKQTVPLLTPLIDVGIIAKYYDLEYTGFQCELNFTQQGYTERINDTVNYVRVNSYVNAPIFFQVKTSHKNVFAHINIGFYSSVLAYSQQAEGNPSNVKLKKYKTSILRDNYFDYGLIGGLGTGYNFKWGSIQLDVRFLYGFGDLYKYSFAGNPERSPALRLNASLGFLLNIPEIKKSNISHQNNIETPTEPL